jgi:uncharacterized membrane protein YfcA
MVLQLLSSPRKLPSMFPYKKPWAGDVHLGVVVLTLAGSTVGSQLGVVLHVKMDPNHIRKYFGLMLAAAALIILYGIISLGLGPTIQEGVCFLA